MKTWKSEEDFDNELPVTANLTECTIEFNGVEVELKDGFKSKITAEDIKWAVHHAQSAKGAAKVLQTMYCRG